MVSLQSLVLSLFWLLIWQLPNTVHSHEEDDDDDDEPDEPDPITYGSLIKLVHVSSGFLLHSHDIKYGSGSRQQTVTAYPTVGDTNSLWQIMSGYNDQSQFEQGKPIPCNSIVRLRHTNTGAWLHSHSGYRAPLSGMQEVTGFGSLDKSDDSDDWRVICLVDKSDKQAKNKEEKKSNEKRYWYRASEFLLQHKNTKNYLFTSRKSDFNGNNCGAQCPIGGQLEVAANVKKVRGAKWTTGHGVYFKYIPDEPDPEDDSDDNDDDSENDDSNEEENSSESSSTSRDDSTKQESKHEL